MAINVLTEHDFKPRRAEEAARLLRKKVALTSEQFDRLSAEQKANAFRIAKVNNARLVQRARDIVVRHVREGTPWPDVRRQLMALFGTEGLPRPAISRIRLIFHQNTMQAYSAARRQTLDSPEIARAFPYRRYMTVGNGTPGVRNVRPEHAVLHGKVFAWDDPFWDRFTPPWDYGCRCTFVALTAGQVKGRRVTVWTYSGGAIRPAPAKKQLTKGRRGKAVKLAPKPGFGSGKIENVDLSGLDEDLREAIEERIK